MVYKPGRLRERSEQIINARKWAVSLAVGLIGIGLFIREVQRIITLPFDVLNYAYLCLFVLTGVLIFLWIWASQKELNLLFEWADPKRYEPPSSLKETIIILGLAILLVGLLFASQNPLLFGTVFTVYALANIFAVIYMNSELRDIFDKSKKRINEDIHSSDSSQADKIYLQGIEVLEFYFLGRPHMIRCFLILFFSLLGLVFSLLWKFKQVSIFGLGAYAVFFLTILVSEIVIYHWRSIRDKALRPLAADLSEFSREAK